MLIRDGANVHVLPVDKIDYVEAQDDYVAFKSEGKEYLKDQTLGALEETLDPARFVRIHRSFILNIDRISKVELYAKDSRMAILRDGTRLPVSRAGYARLSQFSVTSPRLITKVTKFTKITEELCCLRDLCGLRVEAVGPCLTSAANFINYLVS